MKVVNNSSHREMYIFNKYFADISNIENEPNL